jgi:hypothetical protein
MSVDRGGRGEVFVWEDHGRLSQDAALFRSPCASNNVNLASRCASHVIWPGPTTGSPACVYREV